MLKKPLMKKNAVRVFADDGSQLPYMFKDKIEAPGLGSHALSVPVIQKPKYQAAVPRLERGQKLPGLTESLSADAAVGKVPQAYLAEQEIVPLRGEDSLRQLCHILSLKGQLCPEDSEEASLRIY